MYLSSVSPSKGTYLSAVHQPHRNLTAARVSRDRPHCLRRVQPRSGCDWAEVSLCILLFIAFDTAASVQSESWRLQGSLVLKRPLMWLAPIRGHRRNVKDMLIFSCGALGLLGLRKKSFHYTQKMEPFWGPIFRKNFKNFFRAPSIDLMTIL